MMTEFTLVASLAGGALIGAASLLLFALYGRIFGVSGILAGALRRKGREGVDTLALIAGLICGPIVYFTFTGGWPEISMTRGPVGLIIGGLIVGFGVNTGSGCTSGHGICGLSRFSKRSLVATCVFMGFCALTVWITRHGLGL